MTLEIAALFAFCLTILTMILVQAGVLYTSQGKDYILSNRETPPADATPRLDRLTRAIKNTQESAVIFIPLVLISVQLGISNGLTMIAAAVFTATRILYAISYTAGLTGIRTLIWNMGFLSLFAYAAGIFVGVSN